MHSWFFIALFIFIAAPLCAAAESAPPPDETAYDSADNEVHGTEALEMITLRMQSLSGSLKKMPEIPQLNQTIMIPDGNLVRRPLKTKSTLQEKEKTE